MKNKQSNNWHFFFKILRDFRWRIGVYSLIVSGYGLAMISIFPSIRDQADDFQKLIEAYPEGFKEAFSIESTSLTTIEGFISIEYLAFVWIIILGILIFSLGASIVSGEIDDETSSYTFTHPIKRYKTVLGKFAASMVIAVIITVVTIVSTIIGFYLIDETPNYQGFFLFFLSGTFVGFFLLSLTTFFSSIYRSRGKVYGAMSFFFVASYLINALAGMNDKVQDFYFLSFMKYYGNIEKMLIDSEFEYSNLLVLFIVGIIFLVSGVYIAEKRDL